MIITASKGRSTLTVGEREIATSCVVRNELNGWRKPGEVVYTMPSNIPYMPRKFPQGIWTIGAPVKRADPYKAPYYIPSDAWQFVDEWEVAYDLYIKPTGRRIKDYEYGLHHSTSGSTLGCIKIISLDDLMWLVETICDAIENKEEVKLIAL